LPVNDKFTKANPPEKSIYNDRNIPEHGKYLEKCTGKQSFSTLFSKNWIIHT